MVSQTILNILNLQEKIHLIVDSNHEDIESRILEDLLANLNQLIVKSCKTETYKNFNSYFTHKGSNDFDICGFTTFCDDDYNYAKKFLESSSSLKDRLYNKLKSNTNNRNTTEFDKNYFYKSMYFYDDEFKNRILEASEKVSVAMDIGGTFIKIMFKFNPESDEYYEYLKNVYSGYLDCLCLIRQFTLHNNIVTPRNNLNENLSQMLEFMLSIFQSFKVNDGVLAFKYVPLSDLDLIVTSIKEKKLQNHGKAINVTGGGAYKYFELFSKEFKHVNKAVEVMCTVQGINVIQAIKNSALEYDLDLRIPYVITMGTVYPCIVCSLGSGMFIVKVFSSSEYKHLNGSAISGGTAFGLVNYMLPLNKPREFIKHLKNGTNKLDSFTSYPVASLRTINKTEPYGLSISLGDLDFYDDVDDNHVTAEDLNKSIVDMISYNAGTLGYLVAKAYDAKRVIYIGNYICNHNMDSIVAGFGFHSDLYEDRSVQICFPLHGPYIPTIGCFVKEY